MSPQLTIEQVSELNKMLAGLVERNSDGTASREALESALEALGIRAGDSEFVSAVLDAAEATGGRNSIDIDDFLLMLHGRMQPLDDAVSARDAFKTLDTDGDGLVAISELVAIVERSGVRLPRDEVERLLRQASTKGEDLLTADQFVALVAHNS